MQCADQPGDPSVSVETAETVPEADGSHDAAKMATTGQEAGGTDASQNNVPDSGTGVVTDRNIVTCENDDRCEADETGETVRENGEMSQEGDEESDRCEDDPNFAAVCSFFLKFGQALGISYSIEDLKVMLEDHQHGKLVHHMPY